MDYDMESVNESTYITSMGRDTSSVTSKSKSMDTSSFRLQKDILEYRKKKVDTDECQGWAEILQENTTLPTYYLNEVNQGQMQIDDEEQVN